MPPFVTEYWSKISGFWSVSRAMFLWVPHLVGEFAAPTVSEAWLKGIWTIAVFPLLLWSCMALVAKSALRTVRISDIWKRMAYPASMIVAALHMTKALEKLATWTGYLPHALRDVTGLETVRAIGNGELAVPASLAEMSAILTVGVVLLAVSGYMIRRESRSHGKRGKLPSSRQDPVIQAEIASSSGTSR